MSISSERPVLIVGNGIGGTVMCAELQRRSIPFKQIDDGHRSASSLAAAGMYNPMILGRFRKAWNADEFMDGLTDFYSNLEQTLQSQFLNHTGLLRRMDNAEERNEWEVRKASEGFMPYLGEISDGSTLNTALDIGEGVLHVPNAGWVNVTEMLRANKEFQKENDRYSQEIFDDSKVELIKDGVRYNGQEYSTLILCRGYKEWKQSRFFPDLPFSPAKGQTMTLNIPGLDLKLPLHLGVFILPLGGDRYRLGSTYSWSDFGEQIEEVKTKELLDKFSVRCTLPYTVEQEWAGVRPAVKDRKPLLGAAAQSSNVLLFNGLGSRGILMAPKLAHHLADFIMDKKSIPAEINVGRF